MTARFPRPWTLDGNHAAYWIKANDGTKFCYTYFRVGPPAHSADRKPTREDARDFVEEIIELMGS